MKNISIALLLFFVAASCQEKNKSVISQKEKENIEKVDSNSSELDQLKVTPLPAGNELLIKYFKINGYESNNDSRSEKEYRLLSPTVGQTSIHDEYEAKYYKKEGVKINLYKYPQKNNYDFGIRYIQDLDSVSTSKNYYIFLNRLPDIGDKKIYLTRSNESDKDNFVDLSKNIDLVVLNKENSVINSINLNYFSSNDKIFKEGENPFKLFYIDTNYIIHIKYFVFQGDAGSSCLAYIKYKIQKDGSIIRYFDQKEGKYKSYIEEGIVKNNTKEGKWKEYLGSQENMYAIVNYKDGIVVDDIEIYGAHDRPDMGDPEQILYPRYLLELKGDHYIKK